MNSATRCRRPNADPASGYNRRLNATRPACHTSRLRARPADMQLDRNALSYLPPAAAALPSLTALHASHNRLTALPAELGGASSLTGRQRTVCVCVFVRACVPVARTGPCAVGFNQGNEEDRGMDPRDWQKG